MTRDVIALYALAAAGLLAAVVGAVSVAGEHTLHLRLPYFVSGVMGGLAMFGFCVAIAAVQRGRHAAAAERNAIDGLLRDSADWLASVRGAK